MLGQLREIAIGDHRIFTSRIAASLPHVQAISLATGAEMRMRGPASDTVVLCVNGGTGRIVPGTWSPTIEWLLDRLAPEFGSTRFAEVWYRVKSWKRLPQCIADGAAALQALPDARRVVLLGFSMGGAVSLGCAGDPRVEDIIALAPWIPDELVLPDLRGDRVTIIHGSIDGIPGIPGVRASHSRRGATRLRDAGADVEYRLIRGGVHGTAIRPRGRAVTLPRAGAWRSAVADALGRAGLPRTA